jgi:hypothetical protein
MPESTATPNDRDTYAVYVLRIETEHKAGPDGNLVAFDRITLGKKGSSNYEQPWDAARLKKSDPGLWAKVEPIYERWKKDQVIATDGHPLEAWAAITRGQLKACKDLGLRSVEDVASATDATRMRLGMGSLELMKQAKAFLETKASSATANELATLRTQVEDMKAQLAEAQATNKALSESAANTPRKPGRPRKIDLTNIASEAA